MAEMRVPRIAFLLDMLYEDYAIEAWKWGIEAAKADGASVIAFTGGNLKSDDAENRLRNDVYSLVGPETADAIVSLSASLANSVGTEKLLDFFKRFESMPTVHVGIQAEGIRFYRAEGYGSTRQEVLHLIDVHGKKAIAYISGPGNVMDAEDRFAGYRDALEERGIAFDPELVYSGDFYRETGGRAVRVLLDERKKRFDALVSANDYMALFAIRELASRGIRVPEDLPVAGYDDIDVARECRPPLTTVRQPIRELMRLAFDAAASAAAGTALEPGGVIVPSRFVLRSSCGCRAAACPDAGPADPDSIQVGFDKAWSAIAEADPDGLRFDELYVHIQSILVSHGASASDIARPLAALVQAEIDRRIERENRLREDDALMRRITGDLLGATGADRMGRCLDHVFREAGLRCYLVAEYLEGKRKARVLKSSRCDWEGMVFDARQLAPAPPGAPALIVLPLYIGDESLGFFLNDGLPERAALLELIREHLSAAVLASRNEAKERSRAAELERLVADRTADLEFALADAQAAREKLEQVSMTDELTGLLNRRGFMRAAEREFMLRSRENRDMVLAFFDVDGLKSVNDNYGHEEGDWLIKAMAEILKRGFRCTDILSRMGGDEFTVLAPDVSPEDAPMIERRLAACLDSMNAASGKPFRLAYSIGMAIGRELDEGSVEDAMRLADSRLYVHKQSKR